MDEHDIDSLAKHMAGLVSMTSIQMGLKTRDHDHIVVVGDCHMGICTAGVSVQTVCWGGCGGRAGGVAQGHK